jgi:hypothetical protein
MGFNRRKVEDKQQAATELTPCQSPFSGSPPLIGVVGCLN